MSEISSDLTHPLLSVVVIGKNEARNLERCFASIEAARRVASIRPRDLEIIFVDAASHDCSTRVAARFADKVYVVEGPNTWAPTARNVGLRMCRGDLVLFLDGDMELHEAWLAQALSHLGADAAASGVAGLRDDIYLDDETGEVIGSRSNVYGVMHLQKATNVGGGVMLRRSVVSQLDGYRVDLRKWADPDLHARILARGGYIVDLGIPFIRHYTAYHKADLSRLISLFRPYGAAYYFGSMFKHAVRDRYVQGLVQVFPGTAIVWLADGLSAAFMISRKPIAIPFIQTVALALLHRVRRERDFLLGRVWAVGVGIYAISSLHRGLREGGQRAALDLLRYRRVAHEPEI